MCKIYCWQFLYFEISEMAKSIRSKRKRMLRNIKRERYAKKDLEKLKEMVALAEKDKDTEMKELYTGKKQNKKQPKTLTICWWRTHGSYSKKNVFSLSIYYYISFLIYIFHTYSFSSIKHVKRGIKCLSWNFFRILISVDFNL